jgi:hypothetical protein
MALAVKRNTCPAQSRAEAIACTPRVAALVVRSYFNGNVLQA